jgi:CRP/FNR family transcriptional regulator, cyclic AMP receptor protein
MESEVSNKIETFFSQYALQKYKKGQILIHAGDEPSCIFHLMEGKVKQYDLSYRGDEVILNIFKPPAFFPMSYAVNKTPNTYFYEADSDLELRKAPIEEVVKFIKSNPDILYDLLSRVYRGADGLIGRMAHLMASTAKSRIMYELIIECRRFGHPDNQGCVVNLNESDIGARAGLSRETVSRELQKLKADGLIVISSKHVTVPDLEKLEVSLGKDL